jgi:hypothetical protein
MANVVRPPFYVPRPSDDPVWTGQPLNYGAIALTFTQLKQFGQHGQVPTKRYSPYVLDDPAVSWSPAFQNGPARVTLTQVKFYGQPGQGPTKRWAPQYTQDDASVWNWPPQNSQAIIVTNTQLKQFGQHGQVTAKNWGSGYTYDDASSWQFQKPHNAALKVQGAPFTPTFWNYNYDDSAVWNAEPISAFVPLSQQLVLYVPAPARNFPAGDDAATWQWQKPYNVTLSSKPPSPFVPPLWKYNNDDSSVWNAGPIKSTISLSLVPYATSGLVVNYSDEPSVWWDWTNRNNSGLLAAQAANPFQHVAWQFNNDDPAVWSGVTIANSLVLVPTQVQLISPFFAPNTSDEIGWSNSIHRDLPLNAIVLSPFTIRQWLFGYDDASVWNAAPTAPGAIIATGSQQKIFGRPGQAPTKQWHYDFDDASVWWNWINRNLTITIAVGKPLTLPAQQFVLSSEEPWQRTIQRNVSTLSIVLNPFKTRQPKLDLDDAAAWQFQFNKAIAPTAFTIRATLSFTFYDDAAAWAGGFKSIPMTLAGGKAPVAVMKRNFGLPQEEFWSPTFQAIVNKFLPNPATFPFFSKKWGMDIPQDTPTTFSSLPVAILLRRLVALFIKSPRVALAPNESRVATMSENRTLSATTENRVVTAPPQT